MQFTAGKQRVLYFRRALVHQILKSTELQPELGGRRQDDLVLLPCRAGWPVVCRGIHSDAQVAGAIEQVSVAYAVLFNPNVIVWFRLRADPA